MEKTVKGFYEKFVKTGSLLHIPRNEQKIDKTDTVATLFKKIN